MPITQTPGNKISGDFFTHKDLAKTLQDLQNIFNRHHSKYKNRYEWRKAIIENLAAWKLEI